MHPYHRRKCKFRWSQATDRLLPMTDFGLADVRQKNSANITEKLSLSLSTVTERLITSHYNAVVS